ncbi:hypothetical protein FB470_000570 [Amycolatopsis thermophila]|uniref:Uncharacterized protein n=1 Tax=Amycolatopsis thermophila TaxID=206084 RepID=A0ABU0EMR0_9PSEU|nr:hypothetical protein [Amycolatopsis thermophila]
MSATRCEYCTVNDAATAAREAHGSGSPEHCAALEALRPHIGPARYGRAHTPGCENAIATPLVVFR